MSFTEKIFKNCKPYKTKLDKCYKNKKISFIDTIEKVIMNIETEDPCLNLFMDYKRCTQIEFSKVQK